MGTMSAPSKPEYRVILTAVGRTISPTGGAYSKSKIYLLEDNKLLVIFANKQGEAEREIFNIESAAFSGDNAAFRIVGGGSVDFLKAPCNCGMGVVAHAGVTEDHVENLVKVRPPEWVSGL